MKEHCESHNTLRVEDFEYRALVVQTGYQSAARLFERTVQTDLEQRDKFCYGLGKHGDDPGTRANLRSPWTRCIRAGLGAP